MLFNTVHSFIFLAVVLASFYALPWWTARKWDVTRRKLLLLRQLELRNSCYS